MSYPIEPHSIEAERAVLGSILLDTTGSDGDRVWDVCQERGLTADSFHDPRNVILFDTMQELSRAYKPLDSVSLLEALRVNGKLEDIGGAAYIQSLYDQTPTTAHAEYYIDIVIDKRMRRELANVGTKIVREAFDENGHPDIQTVLADAEAGILGIGDGKAQAEPTNAEAIQAAAESIKRQLHDDAEAVEGLPTGFRDLDDKLDGMKRGETVIIGARPSDGKTSIALNIAENVALKPDGEPGKHVLLFSIEMPRDSICNRMIKGRCGVNPTRGNRRYMTRTQIEECEKRIDTATGELKKANLTVVDGICDVSEIRSRARRERRRKGTELVIVDYLGMCTCNAARRLNSRQLEISEISRQLKAMAKELNVPVIVLSQLSRANQSEKRNPCLSDLRDSGSIEQDADVVILLRRPSRGNTGDKDQSMLSDEKLAILDVAKNRNGETGEVYLNFDRSLTKFSDRPQTKTR